MTLLNYLLALDPHSLCPMHQRRINTTHAVEPGLAQAWITGLAVILLRRLIVYTSLSRSR